MQGISVVWIIKDIKLGTPTIIQFGRWISELDMVFLGWWFDDWNLRAIGPFPVKPWHWHPEITSFKPGNGCVSSNHHLWNIPSSFLLVNWLVLDEMFTVGKGRIILFLGCLLQPVYLCISISSDYNTISMIKLIINPHITAPYPPVLDEIPLWSSQLG